jgi:glycosyltransferase involved in cell wall biosynthesis
VLKSATDDEKGVILLLYSHIFPLFAKLFDVEAIAARYHVVLEPSWSGYCDPNVLCYTQYDFPVFVEAYEPRDAEFIRRTDSNLIVVPTSTNWWVDHRVFRPLADSPKDTDIVMVAGWGGYKRHDRFFAALGALRQRHIRPKVTLIGYGLGMSKQDILDRAAYYGVLDQIECYEGLKQDQVNRHLNRAKVNIIWSRKEGVNRAIVEGMFAGVPCIIRDGFNYGYRYPYINAATGCFSSEEDLPDTIVTMLESYTSYAPREWAMANMSCERATGILADAIGSVARRTGEPFTGDLAVKLNGLDNMYYWDTAASDHRFAADYAFLQSARVKS